MTWAKFDDVCPEHPKVVKLSDAAHRLWFNAVCYSTKMMTDGRIEHAALKRLYPKRQLALADELVGAGLWHEVVGGYDIHDFLTYQPARAATLKKRAEDSARKTRGIRPESKRPVPDPSRPVPDLKPTPEAAAAFRAVENLSGLLSVPVIQAITAELEDTPSEWIVEACKEAALSNGRSWKYVESILRRWKRDGFKAERKSDAAHTRTREEHPAPAGRSDKVRGPAVW